MTLSTRFRFESKAEKTKLEKAAMRAHMSLANYLRSRLNLKPLAHGGARENGGRKRKAAKPPDDDR